MGWVIQIDYTTPAPFHNRLGGRPRICYDGSMKKRIYVETTVVSYFTARPSRDLMIAGHQEATRELWPRLGDQYETYVSALVYEEAGKGDREQAHTRLAAVKPFRMLDIDDEARTLAERIVAGRGIPLEHPEDSSHRGGGGQRDRCSGHVEFCAHE